MLKKPEKVDHQTLSERQTRQRILQDARRCYGPEGQRQIQMLFEKYDKLLAKCTNDTERAHIKKIAAADVFMAMGYKGGLTVSGEEVIPDDE